MIEEIPNLYPVMAPLTFPVVVAFLLITVIMLLIIDSGPPK